MAIDWKDSSPASGSRQTGSSTENPWFALSLGLLGVIAGYLIGISV